VSALNYPCKSNCLAFLRRLTFGSALPLRSKILFKLFRRKLGSFDACTNLCKGGFSGRGKIIAKGRKTAIGGCSELDQRYEVRRFQHAGFYLLGGANSRAQSAERAVCRVRLRAACRSSRRLGRKGKAIILSNQR